ncbi:hypothetical protein DP43_5610 [Burkholderia pseudomallei]|nr:hypothetical protein DP43_5610 [Burkholderia pseudomallei]
MTTGNCSRSKKIWPICFGEPRLNSPPASAYASCSSATSRVAISPLWRLSLSPSISTPVRSILRNTSDTGSSMSRYTRVRPGSRAICGYSA